MFRRKFVRLVLAGVLGVTERGLSGDWPRFLGPEHDAKADPRDAVGMWPEGGLRKEWEFGKGKGWACPVVSGGRVLVFHREGEREVLDCLDAATGGRVWQFAYEAPYRDRYGSGEGPRTSPVVSGGRVVLYGVTGLLHCVEWGTGRVLWKRNLERDFQMRANFFGYGSTPLVVEGKVVVPVGGERGQCVVALDLEDGTERWVASHPWGAGYASAVPGRARLGGEECGVVWVFAGGESRPPTGGLLCLETKTGRVVGEVAHRARIAESVNAASPVVMGSRAFATEGYGSGGVLAEVKEEGGLRVVWRTSKLGSQFVTPIFRQGLILGFDGQNPRLASLVGLDAETGEERFREDFGGGFGRGNLVDLGESGVLAVGEFGEVLRFCVGARGVEVQQRTRLFEAPETWAMPALAGRRLYVSQNERGRDGSGPRVVCYSF
ncbi:MAG: hypothetical protein RLZZ244_1837 [Verrucomicrobiota bacterium]